MFLRIRAHILISTLTLISLHPQGHNINQLHTSNKPPPSFLTFLKSRDTRKTCFYCYLFQIFSNVNYNRFSTGGQFIFHLVLPSSMCLQSSFKCIICSFGFFLSYCFANQIGSPSSPWHLLEEIWYASGLDLFNCVIVGVQCTFNLTYTFALQMNVACLFHDFQHSFGGVLK